MFAIANYFYKDLIIDPEFLLNLFYELLGQLVHAPIEILTFETHQEVFDEWSCVLLMYSYIRNYCVKEKVDFEKLQKEVSRLHSEMDKDKNP